MADADLPDQSAQGQMDARELLYERYANLVYSLAMRMVGDPDAAGEIVRRVFAQVHPTGSGHGAIAPWLLTQAQRLGAAELRRRRHAHQQNGAGGDGDAMEPDLRGMRPDIDGASTWDRHLADRRRQARHALETLSQEQRRTLELAYFQGYTQEEIARLTGETLATVMSHLRLSLLHLQQAARHTTPEVQ